jgi:hypothetical protein
MDRWNPTAELTERERRLLALAGKSRKLFVFLREHRHELFDDAFQDELAAMYRQTGQGEAPEPITDEREQKDEPISRTAAQRFTDNSKTDDAHRY